MSLWFKKATRALTTWFMVGSFCWLALNPVNLNGWNSSEPSPFSDLIIISKGVKIDMTLQWKHLMSPVRQSVSLSLMIKMDCWHTHGRRVHREVADQTRRRRGWRRTLGGWRRQQRVWEEESSLRGGWLCRDSGNLKRWELGGESRSEQGGTFQLTVPTQKDEGGSTFISRCYHSQT